ncbi:MAG: endonuclease/exonuclease/phosphatase family protein, partial [Candidatus Saccharimonadales bacterium]
KATDDARLKGFFSKFITCLSAGQCEGVNSSGEAEDLGDNMGAVEDAVDDATTETVEDIAQSSRKTLISKLSSKVIPIVGWIDLLATIDHFINLGLGGTNDFMGELIAYQKGLAYGAVYAEWAGYGSQIELGAMAPDHVGTLSDALNDAETAKSFQTIQKNSASAGGVPIETTVNSNNSSNVKELYDNIVNSPFGKPYELVGHPVLNAYYETIGGGGLLGWVFGKIGTLASKILAEPTKYGIKIIGAVTPESVEKAIEDTLYNIAPIILKSIGVTISSLEKGAGLINNIVGGGVVSANEYCKEIGCRKLSNPQTYEQNRQSEADRMAYRQEKGLFYSLFSTEEPTSISSQLAVHIPTEPAAALTTVGRLVSSVPSKLTGIILPRALADDPMALEDLYEVSPYGATKSDLSQPISAQAISGDDCPEVAEDGFNTCTIDKSTAESMLCEFNADSEECSEGEDTTDNSTDSPLTCSAVPSWTNLPASIGSPVGGAVNGTIDMAVANIQKGSGVNSSLNTLTNSSPDFIALNEIGETSLNALEAAAPGYGAYREPKVDGGVGGGLRSMDNAIMWRKDKWTFLEGGRVKVTEDDMGYLNGNPFTWDRWAAWGTFKRTDGAIVSVISTHMMTNPQKFPSQHGNPELTRIQQYKQSMEILIQLTSVLAKNGPVLVGGDMNTHANQGDWSAVPMMKSAGFGFANDGAVVYLFHPQGTKLVSQRNINIASDHPALSAKVDMNGTGPGAVTGGSADCANGAAGSWSLPVDKSGWESDGPRWLESHTTISDAWTNDIKAGADINIGSDNDDCGKPVYSMLGGTIVSGAPGYTMQVKSIVNGKEVLITYAHGTSMKTSGAVNAGDQIMVIGNKSSYTGMKCHLHLEVKYGTKAICPQKILPTIAAGQQPDLNTVPEATYACGG